MRNFMMVKRLFVVLALVFFATPTLHAEEPDVVFKKAIDGVVWIRNYLPNNKVTYGSGFLIDGDRRLVVTNCHVAANEVTMGVFFPFRGEDGLLINDWRFYENNANTLRLLGYFTAGRIVAKSRNQDLAILQLDSLPLTARVLPLARQEPKKRARLHALGNPANRLWRWSGGSVRAVEDFSAMMSNGQQVHFRALRFFGSTYFGNSGGPVLNDDGQVVGVAQSAREVEGGMHAIAVHVSEIEKLVSTIRRHWVFSVNNRTFNDIRYEIKWGNLDWRDYSVFSGLRDDHWYAGSDKAWIRFHDGAVKKTYLLQPHSRLMGAGVDGKVLGNELLGSSRQYQFIVNNNGELELFNSR